MRAIELREWVRMGASSWRYVIAYQPDVRGAIRAYQDRLLANHDYYYPAAGDTPSRPWPATREELMADPDVCGDGTHSPARNRRGLGRRAGPGYLAGAFPRRQLGGAVAAGAADGSVSRRSTHYRTGRVTARVGA